MVESEAVTGELATARRLVELLEQDGFKLDFAVWAKDDEEEGRLYLVPHERGESKLKQSIRVATTISKHKDELPDRHDLRYSIVTNDDPVIRAVRSAVPIAGKVRGVYKQGTYIDTAYVFRPAA
jgi:hypothetical protein